MSVTIRRAGKSGGYAASCRPSVPIPTHPPPGMSCNGLRRPRWREAAHALRGNRSEGEQKIVVVAG